MGEDIHIKTLVYSKVEKKYIDALSLTTSPQYSEFKSFFEGRYYDLFSLFGSHRSDYKELNRANYGIPDFLNDTYKAYLEDMSYYGFKWFYIDDLMKSVSEYIEKLKDPLKYFTEDDYQFEAVQSGEFMVDLWKHEVDPLIITLQKIQQRLKRIRDVTESYKWLSNLIDSSKTVFLIYFDS